MPARTALRPDLAPAREVLLAEYGQLKAEQHSRIGTRDGLLYTTMGAIALVLGATVTWRTFAVLLLIPPVALVLGWTYLSNDELVSSIGRYLRDELTPRLEEVTGGTVPLLGWERGYRHDQSWRSRKAGQLAVDLIAFVLPGVSAVVAYLLHAGTPLLLAAASAELAGLLAFAVRVVWVAELPSKKIIETASSIA